MSLQLHRPDGKGGLEVRTPTDEDHREQLRSAIASFLRAPTPARSAEGQH